VESLQSESHSCDRAGDSNLEPGRSIVIILGILGLRTLARRIVTAACNLVRHIDALCTANLLSKLDSTVLALLVAVLVEAARDAVDEIGVGADAFDVELATVGYLVARGVIFEAGFGTLGNVFKLSGRKAGDGQEGEDGKLHRGGCSG